MTPWLHLLFIPGILFIGIQIGIQVGFRLAMSEETESGSAQRETRLVPSLSGAEGKAR